MLSLVLYVLCSLDGTFMSSSEAWKNFFLEQKIKLMIARKKFLITTTEIVLHIAW